MTRFGYVAKTCCAMLASAGMAFVHPMPRLIWNATASTPTGLYALRPVGPLHALELVAVRPPEPVARFLSQGGFLPNGVPLLKHVMALPGQTVCRSGDGVTVDGLAVGDAHERDHLGRPLPRWSGCRTLQPGEVFLMNLAIPDRSSPARSRSGPTKTMTAASSGAPPSTELTQPRRIPMQIGHFTQSKSGYSGHVRALALEAELVLVPAEHSDAENAPDYRIHLGESDRPEVGAGWKRTGEKAGEYVSLLLDGPMLTQPVRANLFQSGDDNSVWVLNWNRPQKRGERD